ncbi:hypothetical protein BT63DRAFT_184472 [Microthyrium microscopicum]|uniref:Azaphilone pigments biosynthesis cluster protein L N-terminal domain-containing protein n=1 Tax=Microthyrium microscopicum TaxID=703497 RepID=A0A6A6UJR9_9PEZI|nr:hypothetical protein BT63DRAFT_184472 [Microthyrium microscopicum]
MDPLSIVSTSLAISKLCVTVGWELKTFIQEAKQVGKGIEALYQDVRGFETILDQLKDIFQDPKVGTSLDGETGHIGNHWRDLHSTLEDAEETLQGLEATVTKINKSSSMLDLTRKHIRLKGSAGEISVYQQRIRSYKDTIQVSLQTTMLWYQVSAKQSSDVVIPALDEVQAAIRSLGLDMNSRLAAIEDNMKSEPSTGPSEDTDQSSSQEQAEVIKNMRNCLRSAATVVSSASTVYVRRPGKDYETVYGSDFGDVFPPEPSDIMLDWIETNKIAENEQDSPENTPLAAATLESHSTLLAPAGEWDSDEEEELEFIQALYQQALSKLDSDQSVEAESYLQNCLQRLSQEQWPQGIPASLNSLRIDTMSALISIFIAQKKWYVLSFSVRLLTLMPWPH